ncbi:hypothetical protein F511_46691 [Dorcoceras hygrometricum]|uniref:Uncharacterized protein n=1 Tax=Dorcoceras hygrometricum TaxID=472368 RepID=A0A2Z6ZSX1_9LAMI|nr:hypothetical protein F511_46691 [Dorcoceras hygrometricum]
MLNFNGSLKLMIYNPATFYGIHVSSMPVNLLYSDAVVATGEVCILYHTILQYPCVVLMGKR